MRYIPTRGLTLKQIQLLAVAAAVAASIAVPAAAQVTRVGIGVGIAGLNFTEVFAPASIYVPIIFESFRIEPEIGILRRSEDDDGFEFTDTMIQLGTGVFAQSVEGGTTLYYGGRIGIVRNSESVSGQGFEEDDAAISFFIGPAIGAEYAFSTGFSLGGEAQLLYTTIGDEDTSVVNTRGIVFVRFYL